MKEFYCFNCNRHKPIDQLGKEKKTGQKLCKACLDKRNEMIKKAKQRAER